MFLLIKRGWCRFSEPYLCHNHIYVIAIVKFSNRSIQNPFNINKWTSMDSHKLQGITNTLNFLFPFFPWIMILNYRLYRETSFKNIFFSRITEKTRFYSHQEYYCCLFRKVCFYICPLRIQWSTVAHMCSRKNSI